MQRIVIINGATASGKTGAAIRLSGRFAGEIVSADSVQVYRYLDIGSAKPTAAEIAAVPHHLVDMLDPDEPFDAGAFVGAADPAIADIAKRGLLPYIVGGTGLYIKALLHGLARVRPPDPDILAQLQKQGETLGTAAMHARLHACDPDAAARIHPNDGFRIYRYLEIFEATGIPMSAHHAAHRFNETRYRYVKIGLDVERTLLYERINRRVDLMMAEGWVDEVRGVLAKGYDPGLKPLQTIGYRHLCAYLTGERDLADTVALIKQDTRRYAKRQLSWLRSDPDIVWIKPEEDDRMADTVEAFLSDTGR
ncbi:MAG: tRNA (adenosine(37)-N6)-dimethylallyltransferase MiaA [Deltaproteobacteria bacterium]|nr:MAG: tRNA (adenosine(37)-N6)-dimethylallyltransferase MiaA [Deltaproteobacteria bacterium]